MDTGNVSSEKARQFMQTPCQHKYHIKAHNVQHTTNAPEPGPDHPLMAVILEQFRSEAMAEMRSIDTSAKGDARRYRYLGVTKTLLGD